MANAVKVVVKDSRPSQDKTKDKEKRKARKELTNYDGLLVDLTGFAALNQNKKDKAVADAIKLLTAFKYLRDN
jgi:hypothetical protein